MGIWLSATVAAMAYGLYLAALFAALADVPALLATAAPVGE